MDNPPPAELPDDPAHARELWQATIGSDFPLSSQPADRSYRPSDPDAPTLLPEAEGFERAERLGAGGVGEVYRARQRALERDVAYKILKPERAGSLGSRSAFLAEAVVAGRLEHPNIVPIYTLGEEAGQLFLAMKLVEGETWHAQLQRARQELPVQLEILVQVCNAVGFAHAAGIAHNDLKPSNVMLGGFGEVILLDWGNAASFLPEPEPGSRVRHRSTIREPCGTPAYMAPEQAMGRGDCLGPWTDIFLLGAILCEILRGRPPHAAADVERALQLALQAQPPALPTSVPPQLQQICHKACSRLPKDRYPDAASLRADLLDYLRHQESYQLVAHAGKRLAGCQARAARLEGMHAGERQQLYEDFGAALAGFRQARELWADNQAAHDGEARARRSFAEAALTLGDLALAEAHARALPEDDPLHQRLQHARSERRRARNARRNLRRALVALAVGLMLALAAGFAAMFERARAIEAKNREIAEEARFSRELEQVATATFVDIVGLYNSQLPGLVKTELGTAFADSLYQRILASCQSVRRAHLQRNPQSVAAAEARARVAELSISYEAAYARALPDLKAALPIFAAAAAEAPDNQERIFSHVWTLFLLGETERGLGRPALAQNHFASALEICGRALQRRPSWPRFELPYQLLARELAGLLADDTQAALQLAWQALRINRHSLAADSTDLSRRVNLANNLQEISLLQQQADSLEAAYRTGAEALHHFRRALAQGTPLAYSAGFAAALVRFGRLLLLQGAQQASLGVCEELLQLADAFEASYPWSGIPQSLRRDTLGLQAEALLGLGQRAAARQRNNQALAIARQILAADSSGLAANRLAASLAFQGSLEAREDPARAEELWREALFYGAAPEDAQGMRAMVLCLDGLIELELARRDIAAAGEWLAVLDNVYRNWALSAYDRLPSTVREHGLVLLKRADVALYLSQSEQALELLERGQQLLEALLEKLPGDPETRDVLARLARSRGDVALISARPEQAERHYRQALQLCEGLWQAQPEDPVARQQLALMQERLAAMLEQLGRADEAQPLRTAQLDHERALAAAHPQDPIYGSSWFGSQLRLVEQLLAVPRRGPARVLLEDAVAFGAELETRLCSDGLRILLVLRGRLAELNEWAGDTEAAIPLLRANALSCERLAESGAVQDLQAAASNWLRLALRLDPQPSSDEAVVEACSRGLAVIAGALQQAPPVALLRSASLLHTQRSRVHARAGRLPEARADLQAAIEFHRTLAVDDQASQSELRQLERELQLLED